MYGSPTRLSVNLRFFKELECNLALPSTTKSVQDEDVTLSDIAREGCAHLREYVLSPGEDRCRGRAISQTCATERHIVGQ
jgi:hypothetical protein